MSKTILLAVVFLASILATPAFGSGGGATATATGTGTWFVNNSQTTDDIVNEVGTAKTYRIAHTGDESNQGDIIVEKKLAGTDKWVQVGDKMGPGESADFGVQAGDSLRVNREAGNSSGTYEVV